MLDSRLALWFKLTNNNPIVQVIKKNSSLMDYIAKNINRNELLMRKRTVGED